MSGYLDRLKNFGKPGGTLPTKPTKPPIPQTVTGFVGFVGTLPPHIPKKRPSGDRPLGAGNRHLASGDKADSLSTEKAPAALTRLWAVTQADGEELLVSFTATQGQIQDRYPGAQIRVAADDPNLDYPLSPTDQAAVIAWLDAIGETDPEARAQYLDICASDPRALAWTKAQLPSAPSPEPPPPTPKPKPWKPYRWQPANRYGVAPKGHPTTAYEPIRTTGETPC